jgi:isoamylase
MRQTPSLSLDLKYHSQTFLQTKPIMLISQTDLPQLAPGNPFPQGATLQGDGVNFSIFAEGSDSVDLCLFDDEGTEKRIPMLQRTTGVWHCHLPRLKAGQIYGYRVTGPYEPQNGLRFNPNKVVLDPYAKGLARELRWDDSLFGYSIGDPMEDLSFDSRDSAPFAALGCVVDSSFDWEDDSPPGHPWHECVIYETHVKGATKQHAGVPDELRGTYAGVASEPFIRHLKELGVTSLELMPIHHFISDRHLEAKGLSNYWGYNTLGFFIPEPSYAVSREPAAVIHEFKSMVRSLHAAGIEVILDVVYNHTAEGDHRGPTLSLRGIDNLAYYRTTDDHRYYMDFTGCGNTLNMNHPQSLRLLMDSLRYWVTEMHVDGFRFDLASALARELHDVNQLGPFMDTIYQDPVLANVKLIAEPWDIGEGGYQVGNFPVNWTEWNGMFRDTMRRFWRGENGTIPDAATRLIGSPDLYAGTRRRPSASINFITAHDGFTLQDLVSYERKHNEDNGGGNSDGADDNFSWNCGTEGPTDDPAIRETRERHKRNLMASLVLAQGVPMISGGDEIGRTQNGNNNGYCQDGPLTWLDWNLDESRRSFLDFCKKVIAIRKQHPNFRRHSFEERDPLVAPLCRSLEWFRPDGASMAEGEWNESWIKSMMLYLSGSSPEIRDDKGIHRPDHDFILAFNAHDEGVEFMLPNSLGNDWSVVFDTSRDPAFEDPEPPIKSPYILSATSFALFRHAR